MISGDQRTSTSGNQTWQAVSFSCGTQPTQWFTLKMATLDYPKIGLETKTQGTQTHFGDHFLGENMGKWSCSLWDSLKNDGEKTNPVLHRYFLIKHGHTRGM